MRAVVFFLALTILARAMFPEVSIQGLDAAWAYLPFAVFVGLLGWHARLWQRLPANPLWYVLLLGLAAAQLAVAVPGMRLLPFVPYVKPALLAVVVMVLLRARPRIGSVYEGITVPLLLAFLGFSILLGLSLRVDDELYREPYVSRAYYGLKPWVPLMPEVILSMAPVAVFLLASGLFRRSRQPTAAKAWLVAGIALFVLGEGLRQVALHALALGVRMPSAADFFARAHTLGLPLLFAAHVALFVGAFYLLSSLLPRRAADEAG